jgi:hypothetical protein
MLWRVRQRRLASTQVRSVEEKRCRLSCVQTVGCGNLSQVICQMKARSATERAGTRVTGIDGRVPRAASVARQICCYNSLNSEAIRRSVKIGSVLLDCQYLGLRFWRGVACHRLERMCGVLFGLIAVRFETCR